MLLGDDVEQGSYDVQQEHWSRQERYGKHL